MNPKHNNQSPMGAAGAGGASNAGAEGSAGMHNAAASGAAPARAAASANTAHSEGARAARHSRNPLRRRTEMDLDIPRNTNADLTRVRSLRTPVFTRTRIMVLALALVAALSISGTLAYLAWTTNQTPNRVTMGTAELKIGERATATAEYTYDTDGEYKFGTDTKRVLVTAGKATTQHDINVTVSLVPQVETKNVKDTDGEAVGDVMGMFDQDWSSISTDSDDRNYIETTVMRVYLADGWSEKWTRNQDGTFTYNEALKAGESTSELVSGVVLRDTVNASDYESIRLGVVAQSTMAS